MTKRCPSVALVAAGVAACVSYDPAGPPVPRIDGTYTATIVTILQNDIELRSDTFTAAISVRGTRYRGHFVGTYDIAQTDSGPFAGVLSPDGSLSVTEFGTPPKPIAGVAFIRNLYYWCDFPRLGTAPLPGALNGDSLRVDGRGSVPCFYQLAAPVGNLKTEITVRVRAAR
jgi:hypothetical protein